MSPLYLLRPVAPDVAIEIDAAHVAVVRLAWRGTASRVAAHVVEPLPPGAVVPSLAAVNIIEMTSVSHALTQALARIGGRVTRAALQTAPAAWPTRRAARA